jgi:glutamine amidotransferase
MLAILDYDAGNIESVRSALAHVGGTPVFVKDAAEAANAERIVFPGVGSAAQCMTNLRARGFDRLLADAVARGVPVLAVCIGMQLLFDSSDEDGGVDALGLLPGRVVKFAPKDRAMKVPQMGWNRTERTKAHPLLEGGAADFYFVHSYYVEPANDEVVYGRTDYAGVRFAAMAGKGSLFACQFHPEKSGEAGLAILRRFLKWDGKTGDGKSC